MAKKLNFNFEISLSVLNHLGRNLYRNFITVVGEAISNSWDADAKNVWINIDDDRKSFSIKDDGNGMTADDFKTNSSRSDTQNVKRENFRPRKDGHLLEQRELENLRSCRVRKKFRYSARLPRQIMLAA